MNIVRRVLNLAIILVGIVILFAGISIFVSGHGDAWVGAAIIVWSLLVCWSVYELWADLDKID